LSGIRAIESLLICFDSVREVCVEVDPSCLGGNWIFRTQKPCPDNETISQESHTPFFPQMSIRKVQKQFGKIVELIRSFESDLNSNFFLGHRF
jgi:hypothetical protein